MPAEYTPRRSDGELLDLVYGKIAARRQRREFLGVGVGALAMFILATGVAVAGNGGTTNHAALVAEAGTTTTTVPPDTTTTSIVADTTTTTSVVLPTAAPAGGASPTTTTRHAPTQAATTAPAPTQVSSPVTAQALVSQAWPPNRDPALVYVSAEGKATSGHVTRMTLSWGDGSASRTFQYPATSCQDPTPNHPTDAEVANDSHRYAQAGTYTVELIVTATGCDGSTSQSAADVTPVSYPSPQPPQ